MQQFYSLVVYCNNLFTFQELFELGHDGKQFYVEDKVRHDTGDNVVMNCDVRSSGNKIYVVAGQENYSQLYKITTELITMNANINTHSESQNNSDSHIRNRREKENTKNNEDKKEPTIAGGKKKSKIDKEDIPSQNGIDSEKILRFAFKTLDSVQTVLSGDDPLQRVVRLSRNNDLMVTGGTDGNLRLWSFPKMEQLIQIEAHSKEVDDVDFSISGEQVCTYKKKNHPVNIII